MGQVGSGTGIAIVGSAGVGKSRLLHEVTNQLQNLEFGVFDARATVTTRDLPFAPFIELLPSVPIEDRSAMLGQALASLAGHAGKRGLVLTVDDAHHLDPLSLALLISVVTSAAATVALTARTGESMHQDLVDLWTNGAIERIDLRPLDKRQAATLVEDVLGGVDPQVHEELWELSGGNPLVLHEVVEGAIGGSLLRDEGGPWERTAPLASSARLSDLVRSRLWSLPAHLRPSMAMVAVGAPLPLRLAGDAMGDGLQALEELGLVREVGTGDRSVVAAHPLYGEILKANMSDGRSKAALRSLVRAAAATPRAADPVLAASWQEQLGSMDHPELAVAGGAAALVRHDPVLAERLVRPVGVDNPAAAVVLGRALSYQQRYEEAEQVLSAHEFGDSSLAGEAASIRAQNLGFGLGRVGEARDILSEAAGRVEDPEMRARLHNERGMISAIHGDFVDARAAAGSVVGDESLGSMPRAAAYTTLTVALAMTGDCEGMDRIVESAIATCEDASRILPFAKDQVEIMQMVSLVNAGRIPEAISLSDTALERVGEASALTATWLTARAMTLDAGGFHRQATAAAQQGLDLYSAADPFGLEPQVRGVLALILGQLNDAEAGAPLADVELEVPAPRLTVWLDRGRAWAAVASDDLDTAVEILLPGAGNAFEGEHYAWSVLCLHDAVRLGRAQEVADRLRELPEMPGARLIQTMVDHGFAHVEQDADALSAVAWRFAELGAPLLSAEAWAQAAGLAPEGSAESARAVLSSIAQEQRCEQPSTPALRSRPTSISSREAQVALDAASGLTSPQIAEARFLSVRTVDNHLHSAYRKLEVSGRSELAAILG